MMLFLMTVVRYCMRVYTVYIIIMHGYSLVYIQFMNDSVYVLQII